MAHDVFRLGVTRRLLMKQLDGGHLVAFFRRLDVVRQANQPLPRGDGLEESQTQSRPAGGERVEVQGAAVKQLQEAAIALVTEAEEANQAGDTDEGIMSSRDPTIIGRYREIAWEASL